jgi:molybdopterin molybdotransferase
MTAKMVTLDELLNTATALVPKPMALDVGKPVDTDIPEHWNLLNHTLGEPIIAEGDLPPFDRSTMDGFALRHGDYAATMPCAGRIDAGQGEAITVPAGACISIATGAPVPAGLDTVIPHERTRREGDDIHFDGSPALGANVHRQGVDARRGDTLVRSGTVLGPAEIGLMAACGMTSAAMRRHLFATVFTSGDEVVAADATPLPDQIRNSNGPMVCAILARLHGSVSHRHLPDDLNATIDKLRPTDDPDHLIVTTGGISAGERDFIPAALEALGVEWTLIGAAVKPGKPVRLGRLGPMPVVCLPGNPVAALIMGTLVLGRVTAALFGNEPPTWSFGELATDVAPNARRELLRTAIERDGRLHVGAWQGSGDLVHTAGMNAIIRLPKGDNVLKAGTQVSMLRT